MSELISTSWFKVHRSDETRELLAHPLAFSLLALIAVRAQRTTAFNRHGLEPGQAFIGDHKACGLSEQQYRTAKAKLSEWEFATFKATNKGTIATLIGTRVFDINAEPINGQVNSPATDDQRTSNGQATTTNNVKKENKAKNLNRPVALNSAKATPEALRRVELMDQCKSVLGDDEMNRSDCHRRWLDRATTHPDKLKRVLADTRTTNAEGTIKTTPAQYAEQLWKEFK